MSSDPAYEIARLFMARKGYSKAAPQTVEHDPGSNEWLFIYSLDDGIVELLVAWDESVGWDASVDNFTPYE